MEDRYVPKMPRNPALQHSCTGYIVIIIYECFSRNSITIARGEHSIFSMRLAFFGLCGQSVNFQRKDRCCHNSYLACFSLYTSNKDSHKVPYYVPHSNILSALYIYINYQDYIEGYRDHHMNCTIQYLYRSFVQMTQYNSRIAAQTITIVSF